MEKFVPVLNLRIQSILDLNTTSSIVNSQLLLGDYPSLWKNYLEGVARQNLAFAALNIRDRTEAVVLQFENIVGMIEGLLDQAEPHGANAREHTLILSLGGVGHCGV
jgi:hypothetical protein